MKVILLLFLLLEPQPQKGDNVITITTENTAQNNFTEFGRYLVQNGYTFETKDEDFLTLTTASKESPKGVSYKLSITFINSDIQIRAKIQLLTLGSLEPIWRDWEYRTAKGNLFNQAWQGFEPILQNYGSLDYRKD